MQVVFMGFRGATDVSGEKDLPRGDATMQSVAALIAARHPIVCANYQIIDT
jgi:hypothetical protein